MATSIFLGKIISVFLIVFSLGILLNRHIYKKAFHEMIETPAILTISGIVTIILGLLIVLSHNIWNAAWESIISIIGWVLLIQGIFRLVFPKTVKVYAKKLLHNNGYIWWAIFSLLVGLYLAYMSYFFEPTKALTAFSIISF